MNIVDFDVPPGFEVRDGHEVRARTKGFREKLLRRQKGFFSHFPFRDIHVHANEVGLGRFARNLKDGRKAPAFSSIAVVEAKFAGTHWFFGLLNFLQHCYERGAFRFRENQLLQLFTSGLFRAPAEDVLGSLIPKDDPPVERVSLDGDMGSMLDDGA